MHGNLDNLALEMTRWYAGQPGQIQHFLKVWTISALIGRQEGLDRRTLQILEAAAILHDIGIRLAEEKYGSSDGPLQEQEGAPAAREMLTRLGFDKELTERVVYLVGRHHTYSGIDGPDYQILVEADFLVNLYEHGASAETRESARRRIFRTAAGLCILDTMFQENGDSRNP